MKKQKALKQNKKESASSSDQLPDWEQSTNEVRQPSDTELSTLSRWARQVVELSDDIDRHDEKIRELAKIRDRIQFEDIPNLMAQFGVSEFKLKDGTRVTVKPFVKANLPTESAILKCRTELEREQMRARIERGLKFLKTQGAESLIKNQLKVEFGKGQIGKAREAIRALAKIGIDADVVATVHPQSLTAWVRERLSDGAPVDMTTFSVFNGNIATVEVPKQ